MATSEKIKRWVHVKRKKKKIVIAKISEDIAEIHQQIKIKLIKSIRTESTYFLNIELNFRSFVESHDTYKLNFVPKLWNVIT